MKKCPFCAEEIQDEAIKCKHCGEFLSPQKSPKEKTPWYFKGSVVVMAFVALGPLALPLVWINPAYSRLFKVVISIIVLVASYFLYQMCARTFSELGEYYQVLF